MVELASMLIAPVFLCQDGLPPLWEVGATNGNCNFSYLLAFVLAATVLSLSLGTYSIGLMQSSSVKSEMYPVWAVSLFTLLPCIDPVTSYTGLDYKSPLAKMLFQISLYSGYVLLMSNSTTSGDIGNKAICILSAITFIKGFHRSLAFVLPSKLRDMVESLIDGRETLFLFQGPDFSGGGFVVDFPPALDASKLDPRIKVIGKEFWMLDILEWIRKEKREKRETDGDSIPVLDNNDTSDIYWDMIDILKSCSKEKKVNDELSSFVNVNIAFGLSHLLQRHFLGLSHKIPPSVFDCYISDGLVIDSRWALKVIEIELGFLYETFFNSNVFLHYYQAKAACLWTVTSFIGICFGPVGHRPLKF